MLEEAVKALHVWYLGKSTSLGQVVIHKERVEAMGENGITEREGRARSCSPAG